VKRVRGRNYAVGIKYSKKTTLMKPTKIRVDRLRRRYQPTEGHAPKPPKQNPFFRPPTPMTWNEIYLKRGESYRRMLAGWEGGECSDDLWQDVWVTLLRSDALGKAHKAHSNRQQVYSYMHCALRTTYLNTKRGYGRSANHERMARDATRTMRGLTFPSAETLFEIVTPTHEEKPSRRLAPRAPAVLPL
jgi:hypothetical protein